ncbi:MAG: endolytic transglycosylase MltG [candidate division FCPU426 bacterium]
MFLSLRRPWWWLIALCGAAVLWLLAWLALSGTPGTSARLVEIAPGTRTQAMARQLHEANVIRQPWAFRAYVLLTGSARRLKAGEYEFPPRQPLPQVVHRLVAGDVVQRPLAVPEGFTAAQIAERLEQAGLAGREAFMEVVRDPEVAKEWGVPAAGLEGFLFPDTYRLTKGLSPKEIARRMVERFHAQVGQDLFAAGEAQGLKPLELITLASILEREVAHRDELEIVASIFYNRLHGHKRLESCATVLYSQGRLSGSLSLEDLQTVSPYNTYRHFGLPPGPIGNPGLAAIRAAAHPAQTQYLFFVLGPDGRHIFSEDFDAHKRAKWRQKRLHPVAPK